MVMAELYGRTGGYSKGKGGSMHLIDVEHHFYGGYGIVGAQIPMGAGMAFASKYRGEDRVTVCFFGDAAANQGAFHETLNMASRWALPIIFLCENNKYGMGTDIARVSAEPSIHKRASAYRMRGEEVDGKNVFTMMEAMADCAEHCRKGKGPVLLEAMTYRFRGHSMSDAATYRTKDEVEEEKKHDPLVSLREALLKKKVAQAALTAIEEQQKAVVDEALAYAEASPEPSLDELFNDVLVAEGERDVRPRERVLGATDVKWPSYPTGQQLQVKWDLEPREPKLAAAPAPRKGAA
jgi:pyruvate dehydrogenase E1 component alpha subunit